MERYLSQFSSTFQYNYAIPSETDTAGYIYSGRPPFVLLVCLSPTSPLVAFSSDSQVFITPDIKEHLPKQ
jgi:hypothetical protein